MKEHFFHRITYALSKTEVDSFLLKDSFIAASNIQCKIASKEKSDCGKS